MKSGYFNFFDVYVAEIGWLRGSEFNGVILNEGAIKSVLAALDGAPLFDDPPQYTGIDGKKHASKIGQIEVDGATVVYCSTKHDLTDKRPALELIGQTTKRDGGGWLVTSVKECSLFITDDDNGNTFRKLDVEA